MQQVDCKYRKKDPANFTTDANMAYNQEKSSQAD